LPINPPTIDLADVTPTYIKKVYLAGLQLLDENDEELPEAFYQEHMDNAAAKIEEEADIDVTPKDHTAERHDYRATDYVQYGFLKLFRQPVLSVSEVRATYPTGQTIQTFPQEWIRVDLSGGQIHLVPTAGSLSQVVIGQGGDFLPIIFSAIGFVPQLWEVDYRSGFDTTRVPRPVVEALCKKAVIEILGIMADTIQPVGVQSGSVSVDGLSQSKSYQQQAFQARIGQYTKDLYGNGQPGEGLIWQLRRTYRGISMVSV
jgi:hypothetical protein